MSKTLSLLVVCALSSLLLVSCNSTKLADKTLPIDASISTTPDTLGTNGTPAQNESATSTNTTPEENSSMPSSNQVKTLEDFKPIVGTQATITTTKGDVVIKLDTDKAPLTTRNFLTLASEGFYDGIVFHRVIPDFMAQVGDPLTKDQSKEAMWGSGGPGYTIQDEFDPSLTHSGPGIVSMANTGQPNTGGSQFFITYEATPWLDGKHAVFGKVTAGMDVLRQIDVGDKIVSVAIK